MRLLIQKNQYKPQLEIKSTPFLSLQENAFFSLQDTCDRGPWQLLLSPDKQMKASQLQPILSEMKKNALKGHKKTETKWLVWFITSVKHETVLQAD